MHRYSVFANSCVNVPIDPISKMPKTAYERKETISLEQQSLESSTIYSASDIDVETEKLKDFYQSIPDYNDINHLSETEFYCTLKSLREKKKIMFSVGLKNVNNCSSIINDNIDNFRGQIYSSPKSQTRKILVEYEPREKILDCTLNDSKVNAAQSQIEINEKNTGIIRDSKKDLLKDSKTSPLSIKGSCKLDRPKRNHSACSITWHDDKERIETKKVNDNKEFYFDNDNCKYDDRICNTQSMPSSPLRSCKIIPNSQKRKDPITVPRPFKMTQRDEENRIVNELRGLQKSFSEDMLHRKCERKQFKAKPVPIESRIPLYDKILEDQAMRRAITKINSEAELRAQMKPFSFTKREEGDNGICERAINVIPKTKKKKRFRARPIPKNLFSNYFYDKMKEQNFFRSMNRRIRAEEMLRKSSYPGISTLRDHSRLSTPAAYSDLPRDPSPAAFSGTSSNKCTTSPMKHIRRSKKHLKEDYITTSPQPFHFNTADRANKKINEMSKKICQDIKTADSTDYGASEKSKIYSALDLRGRDGRSNLAALLRAEAVKRKFELEADQRLADQMRRIEIKQRDRLLRNKPAWHLVKNNHEEDIAMRLQTRRDEERLRREEYLHEMELMYGRVHQQPMLFERFYAPRSGAESIDYKQLSPRKKNTKRRNQKKSNTYIDQIQSPDLNGDAAKYLDKAYDDLDALG